MYVGSAPRHKRLTIRLLLTSIPSTDNMALANKSACDNSLAEWMYVAGVGYRLALPNPKWTVDGDKPPFAIYALDPARTFKL